LCTATRAYNSENKMNKNARRRRNDLPSYDSRNEFPANCLSISTRGYYVRVYVRAYKQHNALLPCKYITFSGMEKQYLRANDATNSERVINSGFPICFSYNAARPSVCTGFRDIQSTVRTLRENDCLSHSLYINIIYCVCVYKNTRARDGGVRLKQIPRSRYCR